MEVRTDEQVIYCSRYPCSLQMIPPKWLSSSALIRKIPVPAAATSVELVVDLTMYQYQEDFFYPLEDYQTFSDSGVEQPLQSIRVVEARYLEAIVDILLVERNRQFYSLHNRACGSRLKNSAESPSLWSFVVRFLSVYYETPVFDENKNLHHIRRLFPWYEDRSPRMSQVPQASQKREGVAPIAYASFRRSSSSSSGLWRLQACCSSRSRNQPTSMSSITFSSNISARLSSGNSRRNI